MDEYVEIVGSDGKTHRVLAAKVDQFFDGRTGEPISDADYDESKRRLAEAEAADREAGI